MTPAQELKHLLTFRDAFADQLSNNNLDEPTKQQIDQLIKTTTQRIHLILDLLIQDETATEKEPKGRELEKTRSSWFNELSMNVLRLLAARAIAETIDVEKIVSLFKSF